MFAEFDNVPLRLRESLQRYVEHRIPPGGFLEAVLSNDLMLAVGYADEDSLACLKDLCVIVNCRLPCVCHGSRDRVRQWIANQ